MEFEGFKHCCKHRMFAKNNQVRSDRKIDKKRDRGRKRKCERTRERVETERE